MTTLTAPPLIVPAVDVSELPALDQPDERVCEIRDSGGYPCGDRATWVVTGICGTCGRERALACEPCLSDPYPLVCVTCQVEVATAWMEPL